MHRKKMKGKKITVVDDDDYDYDEKKTYAPLTCSS